MRYASIIFLFLFLFSNAQSQSTYLGYDALDNVAGVSLHGSFGGSGWNAPWNVQGGNPAGYQFSATALNYSNLLSFGGSCDGGQVYLTAGRLLDYDDGGAFDNYVTGSGLIGSSTGTVLYASCLLLKKTNDAERVFLSLHNSNVEWCEGCTSNKISMGYFGSSSDVSGVRYWSLQIGSTVYPSTIPVTVGQAVFLVVKISFNPTSTGVDLFVNPSSLGMAGEPAIANVSQTTSTLIRIRSTAIYLGSTAGRGAADELRFSDSYAVAAPDNTVTLDLPPTGRFTMSQTSGNAPLTINFDATTSSDPEGNPLTYLWNFGDGSTPISGAATISHTYPAGLSGLIPVTLTVSDLSGQQHSPVQVLTLYVSGTSYIPCQSSITSLQEASCSSDNGRVRINSGIAVSPQYTFRNALSANMPSTNGNEFHNLAAGNYTVTVTGTNQCKDTYTITVQKDSTTCIGWSPSVCSMQMGVNVGGLADWSREHAFINRYKHVRANIITFHSGSSWDTGMESQLVLDADGYPSYIPQSTTANASTRVRFIFSSDNGNLKANEQYVFLYDGIGTFNIYGVTVNSNTAGRLQFTIPAVSGNIWIDVSTSQSGNHLRNFRLLKIEDENVDLSVQTFNNVFLSRLSPFKALRFMDWGHTNASPHIAWANRKTINERTYSGERGVPYEMMIKLGNEARKDVWICVPHAADDDYITQMATLFKNTLDSDLTIYLEYSNEVWNWMFTQAHYNDDNRPLNLNYGRAYAEKAKRVFQLWYAVFGSESNRIKRVLGLQGGYNSLNESILAQLSQTEWDMATPSYYFGLDHGATGNPVLNASSTGDNLNANARNAYFGNWLQYVKQDYRNIRVLGKEIVCYEGGQHYTNFQTVPYQQAMYDAQYLPSMYQLYNDVLDTIRSRGNKLAMAFTLSGLQENFYGSWGHLPDMYMEPPYMLTAPKYQAVLDNSCLPFKSVSAMLPLDLLSFDAYSLNQKDIDVIWKVANERDVFYYEIERSANAIDFIKIETQVSDNSLENKIYKTTDWGLTSGIYYYRLKIVEKTGSYRYSPIVAVKLSNISNISVFPNPCRGVFHIASLPESSEVRLFDLFGRLVREYPQGTRDFDTTDLPVGLYVLKIKEEAVLLRISR